VENAFSEFSDTSLTESLPELLRKKRKSVTGKSEYEINTKLIRYALGKGFAMNDVLRCLKSMNINDLPDED
jgi:regulatory protein